MKNLPKPVALIVILSFFYCNLKAQSGNQSNGIEKLDSKKVKTVHAPRDTTRDKWLKTLVFIKSIYSRRNGAGIKDTSIGTGFLLSDQGRYYLVTAKHIITSTQYGKNEQMPNDTISVTYRLMNIQSDSSFKLGGLSGKNSKHSSVAFTDDEKNIAIISLQKTGYKGFVINLLAQGCRTISVNQLDLTDDHHAGEELIKYGRNMIGKLESLGWGVCFIKDDDPAMPFFNINKVMLTQGISGSIAVANDKLIGIMTDGTETSTQKDGQHLHWINIPAKFTKAAYILSCLRKLQQEEDGAEFNK